MIPSSQAYQSTLLIHLHFTHVLTVYLSVKKYSNMIFFLNEEAV